MFFDWLTMYQEFDYELPVIAENGYAFFDFIEGEFGQIRQGKVHHKGSYDTSIQVHVKFNRLEVSGNPSRFNRLDNLFGFTSLEDCVAVYNSILVSLGLPAFTKCTSFGYYEPHHGDGTAKLLANGAVITCLHITKNMRVGEGCVDAYLKGLASQSYLYRQARIHADGKTVDWLSAQGNARELYPSVYDKAHELNKHALPKVKRKFGEDSTEYRYLKQLIDYCKQQGVTRHELKLNSPYLKKHNLSYYGLNDIQSHLTNLLTL